MTGPKRGLHTVTFILLVIGGLDWLVFALFRTELGSWLGGATTLIPRIIYILVGLSALYEIFTHGGRCKECKPDTAQGN